MSLCVGFLFAVGLGFSGMTQPQKVMGFLDVFGDWDPTLLFVMVGAIGVHFFCYRIIRKRNSPMLSSEWHIPTTKEITPSLVFGSVIFGLGWSLGGFCPGPALVSLVTLSSSVTQFAFGMVLGMLIFRVLRKGLSDPKMVANRSGAGA